MIFASVTAALKPYPAYQVSGVPWLGQVPKHWEARRLKRAFHKVVGGATPSSNDPDCWDGDVVWVTPEDVSRTEHLTTSRRLITPAGLASCSTEIVPKGSIIVTSRAPVGNVALASVPLCTNQGCKALVPDERVMESSFAFLAVKTAKAELQSLATGTTFTEVSTTKIGTLFLPLPPLDEQAAIVRYLDHADRKVRHAIRARQQLIKLLTEQKQAIIQRAVTRGLDPNVRLKPSGVPWLGDVPEHWEVSRLKHLCRFAYGNSLPSEIRQDGGIPVFGSNGRVGLHSVANTRAPCIVVGRKGSFGKVNFSETPVFAIDTTYYVDERFTHANLRWLSYLLASLGLDRVSKDSAIPGLDRGDVYDQVVSYPVDTGEQALIVQHIDGATANLDKAIDAAHREIDLLREYRTRLIADVVTGKLDVRDVMVPDDETDVVPEEVGAFDDVEATEESDDETEIDADDEETS